MTLREKLIETGARALSPGPQYWGDVTEEGKAQQRREAGHVLDAILDTLSENADEWATKGRNFDNLSATDHVTDMGLAWRLIAALRDTEADPQ